MSRIKRARRALCGVGKLVKSCYAGSTVVKTMESVNEAVGPYLPLVALITSLTKEIVDAYENVQYNKKTCAILVNRVEAAETAVKDLVRLKEENMHQFLNKSYYKTFQRFVSCLEKIKEFFFNLSQLAKFEKFLSNNIIKEEFQEIIEEFDNCSKDLNLAITITSNVQMDKYFKILHSDSEDMMKFLYNIGSGITSVENKTEDIAKIHIQTESIVFKINNIEEQNRMIMNKFLESEDKHKSPKLNKELNNICLLNEQVNNHNLNLEANRIDPSELKDSPQHDKRIGSRVTIQKKVYQAMDVACKPISTDDIQRIQNHLAILGKLNCPHIIQFRGLSEICGNNIMVFEWAKYGNLKELYLKYEDIAWEAKVSIARDICRGLAYLHSVNILHHDLKCESILIAERMQPKISNFGFSRGFDDATKPIEFNEIIYWLAPEKLKCIPIGDQKKPEVKYTIQCEIFSFGMLLWELCFQKKPYENMTMMGILNHVVNGGREELDFESCSNSIQKESFSIIKLAWDQDPSLRPGIQQLFNMLQELYENHIEKKYLFYPAASEP